MIDTSLIDENLTKDKPITTLYVDGFNDGYKQGKIDAIDAFLAELFKMEMPHSWFAIQDIANSLKNDAHTEYPF